MREPKCPECKVQLEWLLELSPRRTMKYLWCRECGQGYHPRHGGVDQRIDIGGLDGTVLVIMLGNEIVLEIDGRRVILPAAQASQFCEGVREFGNEIRQRVRYEKIRREQLERWLLHRGGATYRTEWSGEHHVILRETIPRRDWKCSTCKRELPAGKPHQIGEFTEKRYCAPKAPRFCSMCVHESRSIEVMKPEVPKGLRLVGKS